MATTYTDQYLTRIREGATYTPASQTPAARTFNQKLEPYSMDIGSLYRQLDINATGPFAERNEYKSDLINYIKGTLLQTASEGKVLEYEDKVRDAILIASFTGRDVQTDVLPNFDRYAKQFTGIDTDKNVLKSFQDYFEAYSIQKQISNLTMMLTNIPYDDERRPSYEAMLEKASTDYATKTADVSTKSDFWRQVAASGNIVAQSVEQTSRTMSTQIMAYMLTGGLSLASPAVSGIQSITKAARIGSAMKLAGTASAVHYTATIMMKAEASEIASTLMDMVDENGNRIPLDIIRDNAYRWGIISAFTEMADDFITPIGNVKLGTKTIGEAFDALKGLMQRNPIGYVGLFAGSTALESTQEGIQGAIRQKGINDAIRQSNAQGFTSFKESDIQASAKDYWNTALDEFKESFIPMAATQILTGGLTYTTAMLSQRMQITPQMKKDAAKYFNAKQGQIFDIGYIDTVGEQPVNIYAPKEGAEKQEQAKASPILMTVNKQTGALVPVYRRDRQYAEYLRSNGVTAIRGIVISDDFVSKVGNTASANNLASILGVRIGEQYPVMGYDGDTIIMDTQEGVDAAAADIDSLKADIFGNPEVVNLEKQENGNYRLMWETDSGRERSVTIRAKNDTDEMRTTTGEGETAQTTGNVNPIRRMDTQSMNGLFNSSIRKSKDQALEDAEVEGATKYFYSQITGMTLDEVEAAWKNDYQAIMERMPAGVDENTIEQGARFMPLLSAITGRTTEDLLNDPKNKISLVYGGKSQIARYKNGKAGYVEGSMRTLYDKDTGVTTYEIRITDIAKDSGTALVHELMHIARAMASQERLSGFVGLKGYTSKYGGMWRSDIKETKDGRYRLGARLFDTYEEAAALVEGNEERFVQDFFEYLKTGEAPNAEVASFFGALKRFLQNFRSAFEKEFSEETKAAFDKLLSGEVTVQPNQTLDEAVEASDATLTDMYDLQDTEAADDFAGLATDYVDDADMYDEQGNPQYSLQNNYLWQVMDANTQRRIDADYEYTRNQYINTDKWMKAPNGQPTNLTERQWVQVRTPAFKEWFGDWENDPENASKIVDQNGEPKVVYHWRFRIFDVFDMSRARQSMDIVGAYFSDNPTDTAEYGGWTGDPKDIPRLIREGKRVSAFLNIRNPIRNPKWDYGVTDTAGLDERNSLLAQGYDGAIRQYAEDEPAEYIAFNSNQIKSATDNTGAFSQSNDNILYSLAYHGSAADFDRFDLSFIGTGENAQAFGWGAYVTESSGIGKSYAKADQKRKRTNRYGLTGESLEFEIENFETLLQEYELVEYTINKALENGKDAKSIKQELVNNEDIMFEDREDGEYKQIREALENDNTRKAAREIKKLVRETTDYLNELKNTNESAHRNLYKVEIPDDPGKTQTARMLAEFKQDLANHKEALKDRLEERENVEKKTGPYWEGFIGALRSRKLTDEELKKEIHDRKIALNKEIRWAKSRIESLETHWIPTYEEFVRKELDKSWRIGKYLDWDEKIGVDEILRVSNAMVDELGGESAGFLHIEDAMDESDYADWKGEDLYRNLENFYESWKDTVSVDEDPRAADSKDKLASLLLHRLGYTGIRYEAERHSRKPGQKSRYYNYVIFDENDIKILNHWTYDTDEEGRPLYSLSPARQAEVLQARKSEIENAVNAGIFVSTEYLEEFRGEAWADAELEIRDWMTANPDIVSLARSSDSLQEFKDRYLKKNRKQEQVQQDLDFDDIPFDEPEGFEAEFSGAETQPEPESEDTLSDTWFEKIYGYAHAQSLADRDRQFAAEWTSSEDKTLELAKALRGYMDAIFNPRSKSRSGGYWTTKYVYNSFKGVSNKVRMLQDGKKYNQQRSSSAEIQEAQKLIRQNPRPYRNAYQLAMMGESRADEARSGQNVGMTADWMRLEALDDDIAQEMERLEAEEERTRRLKTDYKAKYEDIKQKLRDAEKDLAKYQESSRSKISDLSDYLTIARRRIDELNAQIKENEADMKSAEREYSKLIERLGGKIENLQEQNAELRGYRQQAKQLEKQLQDRRARVEELRSQLTDAHKEERRLNNALNALRRWKEAKEAADYRKKRIAQIQRLANFNPGSVDASFEESLMWISNLFERDEEVMAERKSIDERIADLKAQIDTARSQGENVEQMQQTLLQLRKQKKESRKLLPPAQLAIYLPADYMVRADNRQSAWTAEELDVLLAAVKKMRADAKQMLEQKENARMSRLMGFAYNYFQQMTGRPAARNLEGEMSSYSLGKDIAESLAEGEKAGFFNTFRFWNAKLQRLARRLDGNKEGLLYDWFVRENYRHQAEELEAIRKRLEAGEAKWKELGLKGRDLAKEGYTGTKQNGTEYSLTRGQMLGVYVYSKSELGMEKLIHYNGNDFTEADVKNIISELTPTEIEWADFMLADMQANYPRLREIYYRGWNMNLGQRENYFTLVPSDAATESQLADGIDPQGDLVGKDNKAYVNRDFTKNVNPNAIYPLDLDVTRTWNWQVRKQEHFIAYGEWAKDSQYLFDSKGGQIYKVMERTADLTQAKYFKKIVDNVIGSQQTQNDFDKSYTRWLARRNSAVLIGNTGTMLKQGPSWFAAFNGDVDVSEALKNAVAINATFRNFLTEHPEIASEFNDVDKAYDFIWANAPEMKDRQIDMDIMEQLNRMDGNKFTYLFNPANRAISKWTMGLVDKLVVNNLWMSRYYTVFNQQKKDGKTDMQAHKEAAFKASQFISETQPTSMRMDQSASQIDAKSSAFLRSIMVFTNQVVNTYNQLWLDIPLAIRQKNAKKAISTLASSIFMISLAAVLSGKFVKRGDEDGKEYAARLARELIATGISASAPGFGSIVAAGLEYDSDYSTYIFGLDTIGGALKTVLTPSKRKTVLERMGSVLEDLGVEAGYAIGAPVTPVKNIIKGIKNENPAYLLNGAWGQIVESYK